MNLKSILTGLFAVLVLSQVSYAVAYDEAVDGDLSSDHNNPTAVAVAPGVNTLKGGVAATWDYAKITVPAGFVLSSVTLNTYTTNGNAGNVAFFALAAGTSIAQAPPGNTGVGLLGYSLFNATNLGQNLLPAMSVPANGTSGFTTPLPAGDYTLWIQDTAQTITYQFTLNITAPVVIPPAPTLKVLGKKKVTISKIAYKLKGTTTGAVTAVEYQVGKGAFKPANGTAAWVAKVKLKAGKNVITVRAKGPGGVSAPAKVTVIVKK